MNDLRVVTVIQFYYPVEHVTVPTAWNVFPARYLVRASFEAEYSMHDHLH